MSGSTLFVFNGCNEGLVTTAAVVQRNDTKVISFDDTVSEFASWAGVVPTQSDGDWELILHSVAADDVSGTIHWDITLYDMSDLSDSTYTTWAIEAAVTGDRIVRQSTTILSPPVPGKAFRLKVSRDPSDSLVGDGQLVAVEIRTV